MEHGGAEEYNTATKQYDAQSLTFTGLAQVTRGACSKCKLPKAMSAEERENQVRELTEMEKAELDKALADFGAALKAELSGEWDKKLAAFQPAAPEPDKAMSAALDSYQKELAAVTERLKALEMTPEPKTVVSVEPTKELEAPAKRLPRITKGRIEME